MHSYFLQQCPLQPSWMLKLAVASTRNNLHPMDLRECFHRLWTKILVWTMFLFTAWKVIACTSAVLRESLKFHYWVLGGSFLAWLQVSDEELVETSSRHLSDTFLDFSGSLKVAVNLSPATERVSSRVREQLSQDLALNQYIYSRGKMQSFTMCIASWK